MLDIEHLSISIARYQQINEGDLPNRESRFPFRRPKQF